MNYSRSMEEGSNVDGDESGGTSPSWQGAGTGILSPRNLFSMAAEIGIASGEKRSGIRVSSAGVKIGAKGGHRGTHRLARRVPGAAQGGPRQGPFWSPCGGPASLPWLFRKL